MKDGLFRRVFMVLMLCFAVIASGGLLIGCAGDDGANGANGTNGTDLTATAKPESCVICHGDSIGAEHQAVYNKYTDTSVFNVTIDSVTSVASGTGFNSTMLFTITKNGAPYIDATLASLEQKTYRAVLYDSATRTFGGATGADAFTYGSLTHVANGQYRVTKTLASFAPETSNALVYVYIADGLLENVGSAYTLYDDVVNVGTSYGDVNTYVSAANVAACENCHGKPYRKHGYRMAEVAGLEDFAACKVCHLDGQAGGHTAWQLLVDDTAAYALQGGATTTTQNAMYAYKRNVMNDVHMSHAMEFAYPQSMANCATCHAGKLNTILTDANFNLTTCRSCHPVTGVGGTDDKRAPALKTIMPALHGSAILDNLYADGAADPDCASCHKVGGTAPVFSAIHTGYNSMIYAADGTKYSTAITAVISSVTISNNVMDIKFNVTDTLATGFTVTPMVQVSFYGFNTKDFILSNHTSDANGKRMEKTIGTANTLFTEVATGVPNSWEVTLDLSKYAKTPSIPQMIADGTIKRAEIAVLPKMTNADGVVIGLNAPSKTFDIAGNGFVSYYAPIVDANKCNKCHDQLATTFHSADRGGNVVVCRMCHVPTSGGSHLEMQSRSIDSYVHAIHSFQAFDIKNINFTDPVQELEYEHHIESTYPNFTRLNCESCHYAGMYNAPDNSKSLPGILSSSATITSWDRNIGTVPSYVTGPGARACGGCHKAEMINEDAAGELAAFNEHTADGGYLLENATGVLDTVITTIMNYFK